ncbi:MAG: PEGA domain-containing protein [Planctomycetaceae bacterium]
MLTTIIQESNASQQKSTYPARTVMLAVVLVFSLSAIGCLHRRMMIASDPPGAQVLLDGEEIGQTPIAVDFNYYGTREITLIKDGYETRTILQKIRTPWYQVVPLDFISDNLLPFRMTNRHSFLYKMQPQVHVPEKNLLDRANSLRNESHIGQ